MWNYFTHDIAIDLGTANTVVALRGKGVVIDEPSVVAINQHNQQILAVGKEAKSMAGRTPAHILAVRPLQDGVVRDFDATEAMLRYFIQKVHKNFPKPINVTRPRVVVAVPSSVTEVEVNAVQDAAKMAGARQIFIVQEAMAAAMGQGLDVADTKGSMIVDIGGGTTDIALIANGGVLIDTTIDVAGDEMNRAVVDYVRHKYNLLIGENLAEQLKIKLGDMQRVTVVQNLEVSGRDIASGLPKTLQVSNAEVREALEKVLQRIMLNVRQAVEQAPPELIADLSQTGVTLVGGGAGISNIGDYFSQHINLRVNVAEDPLHAVIRGLITLVDDIELLKKIEIKDYGFWL